MSEQSSTAYGGLGMEVDQVSAAASASKGAMRWASVMSGFVLRKFIELVGQGVKTDKGFKEVHLNSVARSLSDFISQEVTSV